MADAPADPRRVEETLQNDRSRIVEDVVRLSGGTVAADDVTDDLGYLVEAVRADSFSVFREYASWRKSRAQADEASQGAVVQRFRLIAGLLEANGTPAAYLERAAAELAGYSGLPKSFLPDDAPHASLARGYLSDLLSARRDAASRRILEAVESGVDVKDIYLHVFQPVQQEIGRLWQLNQLSVAEEHFCTAATQLIMCQLYPRIFNNDKVGFTFVGACPPGELHEIGIRMVTDFLEMSGWDTYFVGANTPINTLVETTAERRADVLGISATILPHVSYIRSLASAVRAHSLASKVKIMVGGYPFNQHCGLYLQVGADGWAPDAEAAVTEAERLVRPEQETERG